MNRAADESDEVLRLSLDAKAVVKVGMSSRHGVNRIPTDAADHDHKYAGKVVPVGLFVPKLDELSIAMVTSNVTADCLVDVLDTFWKENRHRFPGVRKLLVDLDNGPENHSRRANSCCDSSNSPTATRSTYRWRTIRRTTASTIPLNAASECSKTTGTEPSFRRSTRSSDGPAR